MIDVLSIVQIYHHSSTLLSILHSFESSRLFLLEILYEAHLYQLRYYFLLFQFFQAFQVLSNVKILLNFLLLDDYKNLLDIYYLFQIVHYMPYRSQTLGI